MKFNGKFYNDFWCWCGVFFLVENRVRWCLHETSFLSSSRFYYVCYVTSFSVRIILSTVLKTTLARWKKKQEQGTRKKNFFNKISSFLRRKFTYSPNSPEKRTVEKLSSLIQIQSELIFRKEQYLLPISPEKKENDEKVFPYRRILVCEGLLMEYSQLEWKHYDMAYAHSNSIKLHRVDCAWNMLALGNSWSVWETHRK